ncbi:MAG: ribonuclease R, partial [Clostridia bacterium]|nr:ribonuclease R [Clostridia bacterium]
GLADARDGEKVVVAITVWPDSRRGPEGRVLQRLGLAGEPGVDILSVLYKYGLPTEFPEDVLAEAEGIPGTVTETEVRGRWDFRSLPVVTIDSETARDLDDAVSLEPPPEGVRWRLGVHIADVSHYVREGSALDREARDRGTSVYLVDRVIPMLPPRLSNGICSLNPGADRLTVSVVMDFDALGRRLRYRVGPSVIRSRARLTYTAVGRLLEGASPAEAGVPEEVAPMLRDLGELAVALHRRRQARGSIDFDLPEPEVFLDSQGRPFDIRRSEHGAAHRLIEECMLAANEAVAELCFVRELPCLYRVHEKPAQEKVEALEALLFALGIPFRRAKELRPKDFQRVLTQVEGRAEARLIHAVMLRSMQQARYRAENLGHFGLAARFYCHFTSPIRRYPDLVVHRSVRSYLESGRPTVADAGRLADVADHCSRRERLAADAEWDTVRLKMLEYMEDKVGQVFPGIIAGVASYGFYVQLENLVEGLVHVSTLTDDYYVFDEKRYALIGERTGRLFRLGDTVSVIIARVRRSEGLIDFTLAEEETTRPARRRRAGRSGKARKTKA